MEHGTGILIVGAGQAGCMAAVALRQAGYEQAIVLLGDEPHAPYQRPPLSKALLAGKTLPDQLTLRPAEYYAQHAIHLALNDRAKSIDRSRREVRSVEGQVFAYDHLILATGADACRPPVPGADHPSVHVLRDLDHASRLRNELQAGQHLCVVGGGFIGLEVAASARELGLEVTVVEGADRVLARIASPTLSAWMEDLHRRHGVAFHLGMQTQSLHFDAQVHCQVQLSSGLRLRADQVLLATGARPRDELARAAGLHCDRGVCVDADGRTEDPHIWAIGDCATGSSQDGRPARLESIPSANEQARRVAAILTGRPIPAPEAPWFWSDQYDAKLQIAGLRTPSAKPVLRGDPAAGRFSIFHLDRDHCLLAVESVNDGSSFMAGRAWLRHRRPLNVERLANSEVRLSDISISQTNLEEVS